MKLDDVISFLVPQFNDPLQLGFFLLIASLLAGIIIFTHRTARPDSWQKKWDRGTPHDHTDDLDIEHGSVTDLWHAVATIPEKLAEVMPGMLLVIGLLGTFIGLGMALNHASNILGNPNAMSASGAADSMEELFKMLQGLGTKFKTSTWGIIGFIFLRVWSESFRFEEKRLTWVISKVKVELEKRKQAQASADLVNRETLYQKIGEAAEKISASLCDQASKQMQQDIRLHQQSTQAGNQNTKNIIEKLIVIQASDVETRSAIIDAISAQGKKISDQGSATLEGMEKNTSSICNSIKHLQDENQKSISSNISQQTAKFEKLTSDLTQQILKSMNEHSQNAQKSLDSVEKQTSRMTAEMVTFTESTQKIISEMGQAVKGMSSGADKIGQSSADLSIAVDQFSNQFKTVLDDVRTSLGSAITDMSSQASKTLERGSSQLATATREISAALERLSQDVNITMNTVKESIDTSLQMQEKATKNLLSAIASLKNQGDEISILSRQSTEQINKLSRPIEDGLMSVASAQRSMGNFGKSIEQSEKLTQEVISNLKDITQKFDALSQLRTLSQLPEQISSLIKEIHEFRDDFLSQSTVRPTATLTPTIDGNHERKTK
ncbi:MAG: hypothetical protein PHH47_11210 [Gallionella sp.]|nr:hypothetical protein [Gallionella sp.]MDD4947009.1 hypothetical protein [Gallionella sp.]